MKNSIMAFWAITLVLLTATTAYGQMTEKNGPVLMTVDGENITRTEFENIYKKNNRDEPVTQEALDEYVELFVNFKLKVREAEALGMDTVRKFVNELAGYRKQLARPYMADTAMTEALLKEAYRRSLEEVRASHILVRLPAKPTPKDTADAYKKILALKKRVLDGEEFGTVAGGKMGSEDPSAVQNKGDLGYFTAFQMVYPFENAVFNSPVGEMAGPIRTRFGYHIIKVTDRRPARGQIKVAHIMIRTAEGDSQEKLSIAEQKANEVYEKVKEGTESFADLALKYSDDEGSAQKGGELPMFSTGKMIEEFENVSFALKHDGAVSEPFHSRYGWHIVKRLEYKPLASFEEMEPELKRKIAKDSRSQLSETSFVKKLKKEYHFKDYPKNLAVFNKLVNENIFMRNSFTMDTVVRKDVVEGDFTKDGVLYDRELRGTLVNGRMINVKSKKHNDLSLAPTDTVVVRYRHTGWNLTTDQNLNKPLIHLADTTFDQAAFAAFLEKGQRKGQAIPIENYIKEKFSEFAKRSVLDYEDGQLEKKYPAFKALMQEYRDGILLFELTDQKVWSMAVKDTTGLDAFYNTNKKEFMWPKRIDGTFYTCANADVAKHTKKLVKKGLPISEILSSINADSQLDLQVENGKFSLEDKPLLKDIEWKTGISNMMTVNDQVVFINIDQVMEPQPKELSEAKGAITAAYQDYLEAAWITELRAKYKYHINKDVLYTIQ